MPYKLTAEQEDIINTSIDMYNNPKKDNLLKISAVAGSSKSYTLTKISEALPHTTQMYLAYNKAIADEASSKFNLYVECKTTHSLAYHPIIKHGLDLEGNANKSRSVTTSFTYRDIKDNIPYEDKCMVVIYLNTFFLSKYVSIDEFILDNAVTPDIANIMIKYFNKMIDNKIAVIHAFYLKMYHILLASGAITYDRPYDLLFLDECGDINAVTLEIFRLLPAILKVMVGDPFQNIYSFNHTINGFKALSDVGLSKSLSTSFRCSEEIADKVESFCQRYLDKEFVFKGIKHPSNIIETEAIISRTNSGLIEYMIKCNEANIPFHTTRPPKEIFSNMLVLMNLKEGVKIHDTTLKFIQEDVDNYFKSKTLQTKYKTCLTYINFLHRSEEHTIKIAIDTLFKYNASKIYSAYKFAKECDESEENFPLTLTTAHSSKGLTFDKVIIANDFDLEDILEKKSEERTKEELEELRLYYVTATRARLLLDNAIYLN